MSQNLRVATWIPVVDPVAVGSAIVSTGAANANERIQSEFSASGGTGGGVDFADYAEVIDGSVTDEAISPSSLRVELIRLFSIVGAKFANPIALVTSAGAASANLLVKTNANGLVDVTMLENDGGTF